MKKTQKKKELGIKSKVQHVEKCSTFAATKFQMRCG